MKVSKKQEKVERFVRGIRPDVDVEFDNSRRCKTMFAGVNRITKRIRFRRPLWMYTLDSCKHCALHEIAHLVQYDRCGHTEHSKDFKRVLDELIKEYGTLDIKRANRNRFRRIAISNYLEDELVEWDV